MCNETCYGDSRSLDYETLLTDPLIRLVMESDGVTHREMIAVLEVARAALARRAPFAPVPTTSAQGLSVLH